MARIIPNENTWIGFSIASIADIEAPTAAQIAAAVDLTGHCISLNASIARQHGADPVVRLALRDQHRWYLGGDLRRGLLP